jgi:hypothetical protein
MGQLEFPFTDTVTMMRPSLYRVPQTFWKRSVQPRLAFKTQIPERLARDYCHAFPVGLCDRAVVARSVRARLP